MNDPSQNDSPDVSKIDTGRILLIAALVGVVVFGGYAYMTSQQERRWAENKAKEQANENVELKQDMANLKSSLEELKTAKLYHQQDQAVSAANALSILERGKILRKGIERLDQLQTELDHRIVDLEQSDEGRKIASDPSLVQQVNAALAVDLPHKGIAQGMAERLEKWLSTPQKALDEKVANFAPSQVVLDNFSALEAETEDSSAAIERLLGDLNAIATKAANLPVANQQTLKEAMATVDSQLEEERRDLVARTIEAAKRESAQLLAQQEAENRRKIAEAERKAAEMVGEETAAKILADAAAIKAEIDGAKAIRAAAEAKAKLVREFNRDLPDIRNYLVGYLSDGYQLRGDDAAATKGPASLGVLRSLNMLQPGRKGLSAVMYYVTFKNDRPRGPLPMFVGGEQGWQSMEKDGASRAQELLIKYGDLMVEKGMLAK